MARLRVNGSRVLVKSGFTSEVVIGLEWADGVGARVEANSLAVRKIDQVLGVLVVLAS